MRSTLALLVLVVALGCDDASPSPDGGMDAGGPGPDAALRDGGSGGTDATTADDGSARSDAAGGEDAASAEDASTAQDGGAAPDSGLDCSTVGCGAPPMCGEACDAPCGCCACGGPGSCVGGDAVNCAGGCYERTACGDSGCTVDGDGIASCGGGSQCAGLEAQYLALVEGIDAQRCEAPGLCHVLSGHCGVGLGGCWYGVNTGVTQEALDAIAVQWTDQGCDEGRGVCRCAAPPEVRCDSGGCLTYTPG